MKGLSRIAIATLICLATPAAALHAKDAVKPITKAEDQLTSVANSAAPGVMKAVAWGDPEKRAHGAFHKFPAGFTAPLHTHSANTRIVVLEGTRYAISASVIEAVAAERRVRCTSCGGSSLDS